MSTSVVRRVGIIGLGKMGQPMARHLRKAAFEVTAYDIDEHARGQAERSGITLAASPRAVAERSDFVIVVVGFDQEAETVLLGQDGIGAAARPGLIVGIASTVAPRTMARLATRLAGTGIVLLDMPLTRGEPAAEAGELLVMVGGDGQAFEVVQASARELRQQHLSHRRPGGRAGRQDGEQSDPVVVHLGQPRGLPAGGATGRRPGTPARGAAREQRCELGAGDPPETMPMPWAEKDMRIVQSEADRLRLPVPLCGVVAEVVKNVKIERGWPTPAQRET